MSSGSGAPSEVVERASSEQAGLDGNGGVDVGLPAAGLKYSQLKSLAADYQARKHALLSSFPFSDWIRAARSCEAFPSM